MLFLQVTSSLGFSFAVADIKEAFPQSDPLKRNRGPIFVEPCQGVPLAKGDLIELGVAVYGLDDAPFEFRQTLIKHLSGLEVCEVPSGSLLVAPANPDGTVKWMILLDVDDLILSCPAKDRREFHELIAQRLQLGKYEEDQSEFCGRRIVQKKGDMQKHILEGLQEIEVFAQPYLD